MEALTAIGLIANIAQFVDIAAKAIKSAKEIQASVTGLTKENKSLEDVTTEMRHLSIRLDPPTTEPKSDDERALRSLSRECRQLSEQILALLNKISPSDPKSSRQIMRATLRSFKYKREKEDLENKLTSYRCQLLLHFHRVTSLDMKTRFETLRNLEYANQDVLQALPKQIERLKRDIHVERLSPEAQEQIRSLLAMTETAKEMITHRVIIQRLAFDHMVARYDQVDRAHCETFRWIVEEDAVVDEKVSMCNARHLYLSWLSNGQGMFHIAGKLGSGKSTLMKYLLEHSQTKTKLLEWAGPAKLVCVSYFFWRPGKPIQKSFSGMVRSLLYGILEASSELTSIAFPDLCKQIQTELSLGLEQSPVNKDLPLDAVLVALERLLRNESVQTSHRFCFFVDALDEYEDTISRDYRYMVEQFHSWIGISKNTLKICVSSREYNVFENMLAANQRIRMQDLTRNDMQRYVNNKLEDTLDTSRRERITEKIVERSDGIFLWVVLVVKALRESVEDGHDVVRFEKELDILPTEMEELFQYLLDSIPPHRQRIVYRLFAILFRVRKALGGFTLSHCLYLEDLDQDMYFAEKPELACLEWYCSGLGENVDRMAVLNAKAAKLAQSYCRGLLEPQKHYAEFRDVLCSSMVLGFTHRSVPEFFAKSKVQAIIKEHTSGFDIDNAICQLTLADLRCSEYIDVCTKYSVNSLLWLFFEILVPRKDPSFTFLLAVDTTLERIRRLPMTLPRQCLEGFDTYPTDPEFSKFSSEVPMIKPYGGLINRSANLLSPVYVLAVQRRPGYAKWRLAQNSDLLDTVAKKRILVDCLIGAIFLIEDVSPNKDNPYYPDLVDEAFTEEIFVFLKPLLETADAVYPQTWLYIMKNILLYHLSFGRCGPKPKMIHRFRSIFLICGRLVEMFLLTLHDGGPSDLYYRDFRRTKNGGEMTIDCRGLTHRMKEFFKPSPNSWEAPIEELLPLMEFENTDAIMRALEKVKAAARTSPGFTWDTTENLVDEGPPTTAKPSDPDCVTRNTPPTEQPTAPLVEKSSSEPSVNLEDTPIESSTVSLLEDTKAPQAPALSVGCTQEISKPDHRRTFMAIWLFGICVSLILGIKACMLYV